MRKKIHREKYPISYISYFSIFILLFLFISLIYSSLSYRFFIPCANSLSCSDSLKLRVENDSAGVFNNEKVIPPTVALSPNEAEQNVLGETAVEKQIYIDLSKQQLFAFEGNSLYLQAAISSGKWGRTPTGNFIVWSKVRSTRMSGGSGADYYNLPNVPHVMFFSNNLIPGSAGYSLHGAYWHNNFGHPMSHGCINMKQRDAEKLYNWANNKIKVTIYGKAPV